MPKTTEFSDAASQIVYDDIDENVVGSIVYNYAGREVGRADIVKTGAEIDGFVFDNEEDMEREMKEQEKSTVHINPFTIILVGLGIIAIAVFGFAIKKVVDNYYIIKHNMEVKKSRREQFKKIKPKRHRRRRRR